MERREILDCRLVNGKQRLSYYILGVTLILFQCYFLLPSGIVNILKITTPFLLALVCLYENKKVINNAFLFWVLGFYTISILSMLFATWTKNMSDTFFSLTFCFLMLFAISQYIRELKDIETIITFMAVGGVLYALYVFINQYNTIFTQSIDIRYSNGSIMQFTYIMIPTVYYLIYKFFHIDKNKLFTGILVMFSYSMCIFSGRRKALLFPLLFFGLMLILKNKNNKAKIFYSIIVIVGMLFGVYYFCMNNEVLYNLIGFRVNKLILFISGEELVDKSAWVRRYLLLTAWDIFKNNPFIGIGIGNFIYYNMFGFYAHNNYVELLCDQGIFGTIAYYWIYIYLFAKIIKNQSFWNDKLAHFFFSILLLNLAHDFGTVSYYRIYFNLFICLAAAYVTLLSKTNVRINEVKQPDI